MGGHCGGTEAANAAIDALSALADAPSEISAAAICAVLVSANASIYAASNARGATSGTTIVVAWLNRDELTVFWVGDSRAYWIRNSCVQCLTRDHSLVQALIDAGEITATEARMHPDANVVTRALGAAEMVEIDRAVTRLRIGDRVILCSDGVSRSLGAGAFANGKASLGQFADDVLGNALRCDGSDNATIVAVQLNTLSRV
jgi:serine/threonine-protein phosphatase Stp1